MCLSWSDLIGVHESNSGAAIKVESQLLNPTVKSRWKVCSYGGLQPVAFLLNGIPGLPEVTSGIRFKDAVQR